jgi:hypothetical protein
MVPEGMGTADPFSIGVADPTKDSTSGEEAGTADLSTDLPLAFFGAVILLPRDLLATLADGGVDFFRTAEDTASFEGIEGSTADPSGEPTSSFFRVLEDPRSKLL